MIDDLNSHIVYRRIRPFEHVRDNFYGRLHPTSFFPHVEKLTVCLKSFASKASTTSCSSSLALVRDGQFVSGKLMSPQTIRDDEVGKAFNILLKSSDKYL